MDQCADIELVQRLKSGDATAYDTLFVRYYKLLCVTAFWLLQNEQEAKDIVQTFFLDIWDRKLYLQFNNDIKGYLHTAVRNRCLNHIKKQKTQLQQQTAFAFLQDDSCMAGPEQLPDYSGQLHQSLDTIAGQKRMAIQMIYLDGKRYQEAADEMGISINSFKSYLKKGMKLLRHAVNNKDR
ncbi:sigma-70 family RNA polymerase sigma factor [Chitinophaga solisilvae]|uniref:Sigma-70 family RNA polymerase sigma factor n=1 Tax=Chitinophaga solisilvae TaxID=1233460 RepID=A0A3S1CYQ5_9BACT|nr:sigma-70 family RNA polymerase sigma factor [Chitinophaga solisilvae]NSL90944.1 sigma-70 family RNA polymerase sigma factor [Chitinophaga solisilvae]